MCLLGSGTDLEASGSPTAQITVTGGPIIDNSTASCAAEINGTNSGITDTSGIEIAGSGTACGPPSSYTPSPTTGNAVTPDPLANLPVPSTTGLSGPQSVSVAGHQSLTIGPGIYSSISVTANGNLTLSPGLYVITGPMTVSGNSSSSVQGTGVVLYFTCGTGTMPAGCNGQPGGSLSVSGQGTFSFSAPTTANCSTSPSVCPWTGLLIFYDRFDTAPLSISGNGNNSVTGAIYAKSSSMQVSGNGTSLDSLIVTSSLYELGSGNSGSLTVNYNASSNVSEPAGDPELCSALTSTYNC